MVDLALDRAHTALLVMDFQNDIVQNYATGQAGLLRNTSRAIAAAREAGVPVMYVVVAFRPGYPEVSPRNKLFAAAKEAGRLAEGSPGVQTHPEVASRPGEPVVVKHRVGAFSGTDLAMLLRARDITTLVLAGIATSGVVLSTVRYAADMDYQLVVLRDCCADRSQEVHDLLMDKVLSRQAIIATADDFVRALSRR